MRITSMSEMVLPLACAAFLGACGSAEDPSAEIRRAQEARAGSTVVALEGCVEAAAGTNQYVLRHISMAPLAGAGTDAADTPATGITEGSWVKLRMEGDGLKDHIGKRVSITGHVVDDGRDTIGTSGPAYGPNEAEPRKDESHAAAPEHHSEKVAREAGPIARQSMNNGNAPEIAVQRVAATQGSCASR